MENINNENKNETLKKLEEYEKKKERIREYNRNYVNNNKEKIREQIKMHQQKNAVNILLEKLNDPNHEYKRLPKSRIEKYNIKYDGNKYYLE